MKFSNVLESVKNLFSKTKRDRLISFSSIARDIADGKAVDENSIVALLESSGRTPEDLQAAVERILDRRKHKVAVDAAAKIPARRAERQRKAEQLAAALEKAKQVYSAAMTPILAEEAEDKKIETAAAAARTRLAQSNELTEEQQREIGDLKKQAEQIRLETNPHSEKLRRAKGDEQAHLNQLHSFERESFQWQKAQPHEIAREQSKVDAAAKIIAELQPVVDAAEAEAAKLQRRIDEIEAEADVVV